jgi:outer membrane scaffolding protein for murein synthesis (MipA/OmpV family)
MVMWLALASGLAGPAAWAQGADGGPAAARPSWEGAVGLIAQYSPAYQGSAGQELTLRPGLYLRRGRFSITTTGGFVTRQNNDDVQRGVAAELVAREDLRVSLSARLDGGRNENQDPMLQGLGDIRTTVRARLSLVRPFGAGWRFTAGLSPDLLGRGGGVLADLGLSHEWRLTPTLRANAGLSLGAGDRRYMRSYFGVDPAQAARSGHPVYEPSAGLRDLGLGLNLRADLGPHWIGFVNLGASQLLGPTVDSPLTRRTDLWSLGGGLAWRF